MSNGFFIAFREIFEIILLIVLFVGIIDSSKLYYLKKNLYTGTIAGIISSIVIGIALFKVNNAFREATEIFEFSSKSILFVFISVFIFYSINITKRNIKKQITNSISRYSSLSIGIFVVSFFNVLREGIELNIFALTSFLVDRNYKIFIGIILGISAAVILSVFIFKYSYKININLLFKFINIFLILISANILNDLVKELVKEIFEKNNPILNLLPTIYIIAFIFYLIINKNKEGSQ